MMIVCNIFRIFASSKLIKTYDLIEQMRRKDTHFFNEDKKEQQSFSEK